MEIKKIANIDKKESFPVGSLAKISGLGCLKTKNSKEQILTDIQDEMTPTTSINTNGDPLNDSLKTKWCPSFHISEHQSRVLNRKSTCIITHIIERI